MEPQGRIQWHRFEGKKRNNKGGAVTENGKRSGRRIEEPKDKEEDEDANGDELRDARNKLQERGARVANGRDV